MKISCIALQLIASAQFSAGFSPLLQQATVQSLQQQSTRKSNPLFSTQWDEEDDDIVAAASFEDAGQSLKDEDDKKKMGEMGDFDSNPAYNSADIDRVRAAIKERTEALGIEKSKVSSEVIQAAQERARSAIENKGEGGPMLDLSQITDTAPRGEDENIPAMFYEPENDMTEQEMIDADPDGQMKLPDQFLKEIKEATWPTPVAALKEVALLLFVVVFTAFLIIEWDVLLRETYTNFGFIPRAEDIAQGSENMVLPDGWTNGMSEDDFMNFQDEVGKAASTAGSAAFPDL